MKIFDITSLQGYNFEWADTPDKKYFNGLLLPYSTIHSVHGGFGIMVFQNIKRSRYEIWYSDYKINKRIFTISRADVKMIELSFLIRNNIFYELHHGSIKQMQWQFNLMNSTAMDSKVQFEKDTLYTTLDVHISKELLGTFMEDYPDLVGPFMEDVYANREVLFFDKYLYATRQMMQVVEVITYLLSQPRINGIMLDLCVTLLLGFAITSKKDVAHSKMRFDRQQEIEYRLNAILAKMMSDMKQFKGIPFYAREAGMSTTAFKQHFVNTYGKTPKETWQAERMAHCFSEVVSTTKSFIEIAYEYGFSDNASFTKAFKNEHHFSPSFYRKTLVAESENNLIL